MIGAEVRKMTTEELGIELKRLRDKLYTLRTQTVTEKVEDISQFTKIRRDIARIKTESASRGAAAAPKAKAPKASAPAKAAAGVSAKKAPAKKAPAKKTAAKA